MCCTAVRVGNFCGIKFLLFAVFAHATKIQLVNLDEMHAVNLYVRGCSLNKTRKKGWSAL